MNSIIDNKMNDIRQHIVLIIAIGLITASFGCSGTRSIRNSKSYYAVKNKNEEVKKDTPEIEEIPEISEIIKSSKPVKNDALNESPAKENTELNDYSKLAGIVGSRLPTLREQLNSVALSQDTVRNDMSKMKTDIEEIKGLLSNLKETVEDYIPAGTRIPATGANKSENENPRSVAKNNSSKLFSDESVKQNKEQNLNNNSDKARLTKKAVSETFMQSDEKVKSKPLFKTSSSQTNSPVIKPANIKANNPVVRNETPESNNTKFAEGKAFYIKRNYLAAIESFNSALNEETSKKQESEINYLLGECYYFTGNYDKSSELLNRVLTLNDSPFLDAARIRKAEVNLKAGKVNEAKADYQALIRNHPSSSYVPKARKMLQQL